MKPFRTIPRGTREMRRLRRLSPLRRFRLVRGGQLGPILSRGGRLGRDSLRGDIDVYTVRAFADNNHVAEVVARESTG
jgi:hypothetical protein